MGGIAIDGTVLLGKREVGLRELKRELKREEKKRGKVKAKRCRGRLIISKQQGFLAQQYGEGARSFC